MRWRQVKNEETGKYEMVPVDESAARHDGHFIHGDIESFISPVDGSVITDRRQLDEHNRKHNVVNSSEFSPEFFERKQKEREAFFAGKRSRAKVQRDRMDLYEAYTQLEREHGR